MSSNIYKSKKTGQEESTSIVDVTICQMLGIPEHPKDYAISWNSMLGPLIGVGKTRAELLITFKHHALMLKVINFLFDTYEITPERAENDYDEAMELFPKITSLWSASHGQEGTELVELAELSARFKALNITDRKTAVSSWMEGVHGLAVFAMELTKNR